MSLKLKVLPVIGQIQLKVASIKLKLRRSPQIKVPVPLVSTHFDSALLRQTLREQREPLNQLENVPFGSAQGTFSVGTIFLRYRLS